MRVMRHALVTGPSSGIGREVALGLAAAGFHVIAAGRSPERVGLVVDEIHGRGGSAEPLLLDLASLASVAGTAATFVSSGRQLDVLVNNAGVGVRRGITGDGFQLQFGVNHLGHFMLTTLLGGAFLPGARIVTVSSNMHYQAGGIEFEKVTRRTPYFGRIDSYRQSKLANVLFTMELARRQPEWNALAVHPGMVDTGILPGPIRPFIRSRLRTPEEGADTVIWAATDPSLDGASGGYFASRVGRTPSDQALDADLARELWARSERWCETAPVN